MNPVLAKANRYYGQYEQAVSSQVGLQKQIDDLEQRRAVLQEAEQALAAYATSTREAFVKMLADTCTETLRQVFDRDISVSIDDTGEILVSQLDGGSRYTGRLRYSIGASVRNLISFAVWMQLYWIRHQRNPDGLATVCWDEPFVNVGPSKLGAAAELIKGCAALGIQVIQASNHAETIPDEDVTYIKAGKASSPA